MTFNTQFCHSGESRNPVFSKTFWLPGSWIRSRTGKPGNDAGGGFRIRHPGLDPGPEWRIRGLFEDLIVSVI